MPDSGGTRRLTVTACDPIYTGTNRKGNPYTIYEVFAVDESGTPVEAKLRAFDLLDLNRLVDYDIEKREDERHGTSYTLKKPGKPDPPPDPKVMARKITKLEGEVAALNGRLGHAEAKVVEILRFLHSELQSPDSPTPEIGELGSTAPASGALASNQDIKV